MAPPPQLRFSAATTPSSASEHNSPNHNEVGYDVAYGICLFYLWSIIWLTVWTAAPALFGLQPLLIRSNSMQPAVTAGDIIHIQQPEDRTTLGTGTVITYTADDGQRTTHRITRRQPDGTYITRGDANIRPDTSPVQPDDIHGVARILVPLIGKPLLWLHTNQLLLLGGWLLVTVGAVHCVHTWAPVRRQQQKEGG